MKSKNWIIAIIALLILIGIGVYFSIKNTSSNNNSEYEANKTSSTNTSLDENTENSHEQNNESFNNNFNSSNSDNYSNEKRQGTTKSKDAVSAEETVSTFSTKIYSSDKARQNNIQITCKSLDGTIVQKGETFSFCNTVGKATSAKGYQEADIFDHDGNKKKGIGGGNCQVSSTLYNALLNAPSLKITERHEHSNKVPYVAKGKDAAVAYGSYDLKFINNSNNDIKITASTNGASVTISLISIKNS